MNKFLLLLAFLHLASALTATMNNALRNQVVIDLKNALVPIVSKKIEHISIPNIEGKQSGVKYKISKINIHVNPIDPKQIGFLFQQPATIRFSGDAMAMQGGAKINGKLGFISATVEAKIKVKKANFVVGITLTAVNNKPNIRISEFKLDIATKNIDIKIKGGFIGNVINFIVDLLKGYIVKSVVKAIKSEVPPLVTNLVNKMLNGLPDTIPISDKIHMKYQFPKAPTVKDGYLFTGIVAYLHPAGDPTPLPGPATQIPEFDAKNPKNIQFFLSDYVVKSAINTAYKLGLMKIQVNHKLKDHQIAMVCTIAKLPDFKFAGSIQVTADGSCTVALDKDPKPKFEVSATLQLGLAEDIKKAVIYFRIEKLEFSKLEFKIIQPIDIQWFKDNINEVFDIIRKIINGQLGQQGIPLPTVKEVDYKDMVQYVGNGFTMIGTNPVFHFKMDGMEEGIIDYSSETVIVDGEDWAEDTKEE